jgi:transposase-like protein
MKCKHCGSENIILKGRRKCHRSFNQTFKCKNCSKKFSMRHGKFDHAVVLNAVCIYNSGKSLAKTSEILWKEHKVEVTPMTILRWAKMYGSSYLRLRKSLLEKYAGKDPIKSKQFVHSGLVYAFMIHQLKLNEFCKYEGLREYLGGLDDWVDKYFSSGTRCSQIKSSIQVDVEEKKNFLCEAVKHALRACEDMNERHSIVQKHLLYNDSSTIAVEVPVFAYDKKLGPICGHIDALQVRFGKLWVIDYKPGAAFLNKERVIPQLYWYARALSFRAKVPFGDIKCAWFDEQKCLEFEPGKVRLKDKETCGGKSV